MLYLCIGYLPIAFSGRVIYPFPLTPNAGIEFYNYAAGIVICAQPIILLFLLRSVLLYFQRVNLDRRINDWIKKSTQDVLKMVFAVLLFRIKELGDYLFFENVVPSCFDPFWFLVAWEIAPVVLLITWALISAKRENNANP